MRNLAALPASWKAMEHRRGSRVRAPLSARRFLGASPPLEGAGPWIVFAIGLLLMLAAAFARGEEGSAVARRTDRFNGTLGSGSKLRVLNVSGDVVASAGREFSAVCNTTVTASTKARAEEILARTRILQLRDGDELTLESRWPEMTDEHGRTRKWWVSRDQWSSARCRDCRITMHYEVVVPPGVVALLRTVNGDVRIQDVDGELDAQSVNGNVAVRGSRRSVRAQTVNGRVEVAAAAAPPGAPMELTTVSGSILLTLPRDARFDLSASAMNGSIESTFALPVKPDSASRPEAAAVDEAHRHPAPPEPPERPRARAPRPVVVQRNGEDVLLDVPELERELAESTREVDAQVRESLRDADREIGRMKFLMPGGEYRGSIGQGGARVRLSTLNGRITLLASGTREADAKPLVARRSFVVTIPRVEVRVPNVRVHVPSVTVRAPREPRAPRAHIESPEDEGVVRGDVAGDFLATAGAGTYRVGKVTGKVNILTHSGEIHVGSAGAGADLKTYGGDIQIGPVQGDLKAQTLAGDIRVGAVAGSVSAETSGGDIRIDRIVGSADAHTGGGDVILPAVGGGVRIETGGGEVRVGLLSREARGGITIRNAGGDVTLTLPANFRGEIDLTASDAEPDETAIRSDFPEISVTRRAGSQQATGTLNGGGPRVTVRTSSGSIRVRKGPAA